MSNTTNRHQELKAILDRLKLAGMAKHFADLALRAAKEGLSHEAYLHELARQEEAIHEVLPEIVHRTKQFEYTSSGTSSR